MDSQETPKAKVSLNPINHLLKGLQALVKTNLSGAVIMTIVQAVTPAIMTFGVVYLLLQTEPELGFSMFANAIAAGLLFVLVMAFFGAALTRLIITAARGQKISVGNAFAMALQRFPLAFRIYAYIAALLLAFVAVIAILGAVNKFLAALGVVAGVVLLIIYGLRWLYLPFIIVDDDPPLSVKDALGRSKALWFVSGGAIVLYGLLSLVIGSLMGSVTSNQQAPEFSQTEVPTYNITYDEYGQAQLNTTTTKTKASDKAYALGLGYLVISSLISSVVTTLSASGQAHIYNQALTIKRKS